MPSDYWTASDYLATIAGDYPATIGYTRGRGSLGGAAPVFVPWGGAGPGARASGGGGWAGHSGRNARKSP